MSNFFLNVFIFSIEIVVFCWLFNNIKRVSLTDDQLRIVCLSALKLVCQNAYRFFIRMREQVAFISDRFFFTIVSLYP